MMRIIAIISGSSTVGKTTVAVALAQVLQAKGRKLCLMTQDLSPFTDNLAPDGAAIIELQQVVSGRLGLNAVLRRDASGIDLLPLRCDEPPGELDRQQADAFYGNLSALESYDTLILDVRGGLSQQALTFCLCATEAIVVVTPETPVLTDTLELLKALAINGFHDPLKFVVNKCASAEAAREAYARLLEPMTRRLHIALEYLGSVSWDEHLARSGIKCRDFLKSSRPAVKDLEKIGEILLSDRAPTQALAHPASFWEQLMALMLHPLQLPEREPHQPNVLAAVQVPGPAQRAESPCRAALVDAGDAAAADMVAALNAIAQRLADTTTELGAIRRLLENERRPPPLAESHETPDTEVSPEVIPLDFEGFVAGRKPKP